MKTKSSRAAKSPVNDHAFTLSVEQHEDTIRITFVGDLDGSVEHEVSEAVRKAMESPTIASVIVDVGAVSFIDSSGIRFLLFARQTASERNIDFSLDIASNGVVLRLLAICGLTEIFVESQPKNVA